VDAIQDFEDFLELLDRHRVRYLIIGGLAFIYHAKPRFTKDIGSPSKTCWRSRSASTTPATRRTRACSAWCSSGDAG
jgi:hypothetical protein